MKRMKKLASLVLATIMVLAMAIPAAAAPASEDGTITINEAVKNHTYSIYRIFDLESVSGDAYSYKVRAEWKNFATSSEAQAYVHVDDQEYVTWVKEGTDTGAAEFAKLALEWVKKATPAIKADRTGMLQEGENTVVFENLPLGYYLIDSTMGTLCALDTTDKDAVVTEKNERPELDKTVEEDSTGDYGKKADADIGQTVNFQATIKAMEGAQNYIMHDEMGKGLKFNEDSITVTLKKKADGDLAAAQPVEATNYKVKIKANGDLDANIDCTFHVVFEQDFCDTLKTGDVIVVSYSATVTADAIVVTNGENTAHLSYGDESKFETIPSTVQVNTWEIPIFKFYMNGTIETGLENAKFKLSSDKAGEKLIKFDAAITSIESGNVPIYRVKSDGAVTEMITDAAGKFILRGLDSGTYYLTEIEAPAGYNRLSGPVEITISAEGGKVTYAYGAVRGDADKTLGVKIENKSGSLLPSTGGIGTTIFYVVGGILVVAAVVLLVTRKRMSTEK